MKKILRLTTKNTLGRCFGCNNRNHAFLVLTMANIIYIIVSPSFAVRNTLRLLRLAFNCVSELLDIFEALKYQSSESLYGSYEQKKITKLGRLIKLSK